MLWRKATTTSSCWLALNWNWIKKRESFGIGCIAWTLIKANHLFFLSHNVLTLTHLSMHFTHLSLLTFPCLCPSHQLHLFTLHCTHLHSSLSKLLSCTFRIKHLLFLPASCPFSLSLSLFCTQVVEDGDGWFCSCVWKDEEAQKKRSISEAQQQHRGKW